MVRDDILSPGLNTESHWLYARLCKAWCTTTVDFLVSARIVSDYLSPDYSNPRKAMRWMLGMMEAGLFPGVAYYLSWYAYIPLPFGPVIRKCSLCAAGTSAPNTVSVLPYFFRLLPHRARSAVCSQYVVSSLTKRVIHEPLFHSCVQTAISDMHGVGGKPAWAWIFILEGLATVIAGAASFFIIQDFPDTARFLTEAERAVVIRRLQDDDQFSAGGEKFQLRNIISSLKDTKTWLGSKHGLLATFSNAQFP